MGDFNGVVKTFSHGKDSIAVRNYVGGILGGVFLDMTNWPEAQKSIPVLTIIERNTTTGVCRPLPLNNKGNYATTTVGEGGEAHQELHASEGHEIIGVTVATYVADKPAVGVINAGEINDTVLPFAGGSGTASTGANLAIVKAALKGALPTLILNHD